MNATRVVDRPAGFVGATHPWNGEAAADALRDVFGRGKKETRRVLVPSAAMTEEIIALAQLSFHTFVADPDAQALRRVRSAAQGAKVDVTPLRNDFLEVPVTLKVDVIVDRLYFHTLPSSRRADWVHKVARILPENGSVVGFFLIGHGQDGPPYPISREALRFAMARNFEIKSLDLSDWRGPDGYHAAKGVFRRL